MVKHSHHWSPCRLHGCSPEPRIKYFHHKCCITFITVCGNIFPALFITTISNVWHGGKCYHCWTKNKSTSFPHSTTPTFAEVLQSFRKSWFFWFWFVVHPWMRKWEKVFVITVDLIGQAPKKHHKKKLISCTRANWGVWGEPTWEWNRKYRGKGRFSRGDP